MDKWFIVLSDGTEISSGAKGSAIMSHSTMKSVNSGKDITPGSVCSTLFEAKVFSPGGNLNIAAGDSFTVFTETDGVRKQYGVFYAEKPVKSSANSFTVSAYDSVSKLDKDCTAWLNALNGFPYPMQTFLQMVCEECGVSISDEQIPNGDFLIGKFALTSVTGRQLVKWCAEMACRFAYANADGELVFGWYAPTEHRIAPRGGTGVSGYYSGSLKYEDYTTPTVDRVQIRQADNDVGVLYPSDAEGETYIVNSNRLLMAYAADDILQIARCIYENIGGGYTPMEVAVPRGCPVMPGDIVTITDANGVEFQSYVTDRKDSVGKAVLSSVGTPSRGSSSAVADRRIEDLRGRMLLLDVSMDGVKAEAKETRKEVAENSRVMADLSTSFEVFASGISARIVEEMTNSAEWGGLLRDITEIKATANGLEISIGTQEENLNGFLDQFQTFFQFLSNGLRIGMANSEFDTLLSNTKLAFRQSGVEVAYISNNRLYITEAWAKEGLSIGSPDGGDYVRQYVDGSGIYCIQIMEG